MPVVPFGKSRGALTNMRLGHRLKRRRTDRQQWLAVAIVLMLLGGQMVAAMHFLLVPHAIDPQTGKVVHCRTAQGHCSDHAPTKNPDSNTPDGESPGQPECYVYTLFQHAKKTVTSPSVAVQVSAIAQTAPLPAEKTVFIPSVRLFLISPANSPPLMCVS